MAKYGRSRSRKSDIDKYIATLLDVDVALTSAITLEFLNQVKNYIIEEGEVYLPAFGIFRLVERKGKRLQYTELTKGTFKKGVTRGTITVAVKRKYYISFRKSKLFAEQIRELFGKEKVVEDKNGEARGRRVGK